MSEPDSVAARSAGMGRWFATAAVLAVLAVLSGIVYPWLMAEPPLPVLADRWWLRTPPPDTEDTSVRPFVVTSPADLMHDIRARLERAERRLMPPLEGAAFTYGFNSDYLKQVLLHWRTKYDWRAGLERLNQFDQFKTNIEGLDIHFIHVKPKVSNDKYRVEPVLLLHGWPGSVVEFRRLLPLLSRPRPGHQVVFEVICPSLPGYGFSAAAEKPGLGAPEVAAVMRKLMLRLGFGRFFVQGGDWGSVIAAHMGTLFPSDVAGIHLNMAVVQTWRSHLLLAVGALLPGQVGSHFFQQRLYPLHDRLAVLVREMGYLHLQATKPDTVGVALSDSPAGLAAYILEKFSSWTDLANVERPDGGLTDRFALDHLLDNVMVYWLSGSITSSMRLYAETLNRRVHELQLERITCHVPVGVLFTPHELLLSSPRMLATKFADLVDTRELEQGGHFLAMERPQLLAEHLFVTVTAIRRREQQQQQQQQPQQQQQ